MALISCSLHLHRIKCHEADFALTSKSGFSCERASTLSATVLLSATDLFQRTASLTVSTLLVVRLVVRFEGICDKLTNFKFLSRSQ